MALYRFIGTTAVVFANGIGTELNRFGQTIDLTDEQARIDEGNRIPLISDQEFRRLGFTDREVELYPTSNDQRTAPAAFLAKKEAALDGFRKAVEAIYSKPAVQSSAIAEDPVSALPEIAPVQEEVSSHE